jgi:inorganic pyrophosphatase
MENQYTKASDYLGKKVILTIDRQFSTKHPKHEFMYELNYGFVPNTLSPDGEELDGKSHSVFFWIEQCDLE